MSVRLPTFKSTEGFDHRVWILFYGRIIAATGFSIVMPFLALYLYNNLGVSMSVVGLVLLISAVVGAVGQIIGGEISDIIGRRKIMILAMSLRAITFLVLSIVIASGADIFVIAALISVSSFCGSLFEPATNAMIADVVAPKKRLEAYGLLRIGANLGWAIGPMLGGVLAMLSFSFLFVISAAATGMVATVVFLYIDESLSSSSKRVGFSLNDIGHIRKDHRFMAFSIISIFLFIMFGQMTSTFAVFASDSLSISTADIGYLFALNGVMVVFIQFPVARWINHYKMTRVIALGSLLYVIGYGLVGIAPNYAFLALCMVIITMGEIIVSPSSMTLVAKMSPDKERGRYQGVYGLVGNFGFSAGPFFGGVLLDTLIDTPIYLWLSIAGFGMVAFIGFLLLGKRMPVQVDMVDGSAT